VHTPARRPLPPPLVPLLTLAAAAAAVQAQPAAPAAAASAPAQQIEVTATRDNDSEQRRQSTAAKIVIGREEIERFGDSTLGEVLRRLPGVTTQGPAGRGGPPRMRGLGAGYTQILIDGQRVPPGFSLESLTPEQVDRIEILRAPTAETGARAIGGTINIITREGYRRRVNDLRLGLGVENGQVSPGLFWTRNDTAGDLTYNLSAGLLRGQRLTQGARTHTLQLCDDDRACDALRDETETTTRNLDHRLHLNLSGRLQWRLSDTDSLVLMPMVFGNRSDGTRDTVVSAVDGAPAPVYSATHTDSDSRYTLARLNGQWRGRLGSGWRLEAGGGLSQGRGHSQSLRTETRTGGPLLIDESADSRDRTLLLTTKASKLLDSDHSLVSGAEIERVTRSETFVRNLDGSAGDGGPAADTDGDLRAQSQRLALYAQDEWALTPNWAVHAGVRWEGIRTRSDRSDDSRTDNRSSVLSPLLHAVWKPDPKARDQIRISLTRSYKPPTLQSLVARYRESLGVNSPTNPDRNGNPDLKPELATGIDIAFERYLPQGGVLSANVFHRQIRDYIRSTAELQADGPLAGRYLLQPRNSGRALTQGIELEARFRLDQLIDGAPPVELRNNLSLFRSRVRDVPGPDNRLDEQPHATANLGADHRFRGTPLTLGGSLNLTPGHRTQLSDTDAVRAGRKRQFDAYALWVFNPGVQLRLLASNLVAEDHLAARSSQQATRGITELKTSTTPTHVNWQLRLELKL